MKQLNEFLDRKNMRGISDITEARLSLRSEGYVNEASFKDIANKAKDTVMGFFTKVSNWFINTFDGLMLEVFGPVNIFQGYANGTTPTGFDPILGVQASKFKKFGGKSADIKIVLSKKGSTLEGWKKMARITESEVGRNREGRILLENSTNEGFFNQMINENSLEHENTTVFDMNQVGTKMLVKLLNGAIKNTKIKYLVWGAPGIGKTTILRNLIDTTGQQAVIMSCNLSQMNPDDFTLPYFERDSDGRIIECVDMPKNWLPTYRAARKVGDFGCKTMAEVKAFNEAADNAANGATREGEVGRGGVIFFDEIARATRKVQNAALQIIEDREIAGCKIGSKWCIIAASNRVQDNPDIEFDNILGNRFMQVNFVPSLEDWLQWAKTKNYMNKEVLAFIELNKQYNYLWNMEDDATIFATPRTWEYCCMTLATMAGVGEDEGFNLDDIDSEVIGAVINSAVGGKIAREFMTYYDLTRAVDIKSLYNVWKDPKKAPKFQSRLDLNHYMVTQALANRGNDDMPTPEEYKNFCIWASSSKSEVIAMNVIQIIWDRWVDIRYGGGETNSAGVPAFKGKTPPRVSSKWDPATSWNKYSEGTDVVIKTFPELSKKFDTF